jgi:hypothetical protein
MLSQEKLLRVIDADLHVCRNSTLDLADERGSARRKLEIITLVNHLTWTNKAGHNQTELERIVHSLEINPVLGGCQHWREKATL